MLSWICKQRSLQRHQLYKETYMDRQPEPAVDAEPPQLQVGLGNLEELELLLRICSHLTLRELGRLACVSTMFGRKTTAGALSVVEESARRWVLARSEAEQERVKLWADESWLRRVQGILSPLPRRWWRDPRWTVIALSNLTRWAAHEHPEVAGHWISTRTDTGWVIGASFAVVGAELHGVWYGKCHPSWSVAQSGPMGLLADGTLQFQHSPWTGTGGHIVELSGLPTQIEIKCENCSSPFSKVAGGLDELAVRMKTEHYAEPYDTAFRPQCYGFDEEQRAQLDDSFRVGATAWTVKDRGDEPAPADQWGGFVRKPVGWRAES